MQVRLLPFEIADGPANMAADETLAVTAVETGTASLRFYGWTPATLSLGYFQAAAARLANPRLAALPWVRRPSGGATLVHDRELTYCLALPPGSPWQSGASWMTRMHALVAHALSGLGAATTLVQNPRELGEVLCFQQQTPGDVLAGPADVVSKIVGSAQRKYHRALLQHGAVLLGQSPHTPELPGIAELTGVDIAPRSLADAIAAAFERRTGWRLLEGQWTDAEMRRRATLSMTRYAAASWNERRC
jgi:lipoate-protein ligase A